MFGFRRRKRRKELKKAIYKQAQLNKYARKIDMHIARLNENLSRYVSMAKKGKETHDDGMIMAGVKYAGYIESSIVKVREMKLNLELSRINLDNQDAYKAFISSVQDFTKDVKKQKVSRFWIARILRRHRRANKNLLKEVDLVDSKIEKIDKKITEVFTDTKNVDFNEIENFFNKYK